MTKFVTISKAEYERLKELEKRMNILIQSLEIQTSTFFHGLELLKRQKNIMERYKMI
jgi:hypothetical protein